MRKLFSTLVAFAAALVCGGAWGATPVAVWNGDFGVTAKGGVTLDLNGNTAVDAGKAIQITADNGVMLTNLSLPTAMVLVQYTNLTWTTESKKIVLATHLDAGNSSYKNLTGIYLNNTDSKAYGIWQGGAWGNAGSAFTTPEDPDAKQAYAVGFESRATTGDCGTKCIFLNDAGTASQIYHASVLRGTKDANEVKTISVGGFYGDTSNAAFQSASGMCITAIAVFDTWLTAEQVAAYEFPRVATIAEDATISSLITPTGSNDVDLTVTEDATLTVNKKVTGATITLDVAEGKTLTFDGDYAFEATSAIKITGAGQVSVSNTSKFASLLSGNGTLKLTAENTFPTSKIFADSWTGTMVLAGSYAEQQSNGYEMRFCGNENSKVEFTTDFAKYLSNYSFTIGEWIIDEGVSVNLNNGWGNTYTVNKLTGSGDLTVTKPNGQPNIHLKIIDASAFRGSLSNTGSGTNAGISIGAKGTRVSGAIQIAEGAELTIASGKTISAQNGVQGSGTLVLLARPTTVPSGLQNAAWTGTVWMKGITWNSFDFGAYGHSGSKVKLTGVSGYGPSGTNYACNPEVILEDDGDTKALTITDGYSSAKYTFKKVSGSGTFKDGKGGPTHNYQIEDMSAFTGAIESNKLRLTIGTSTSDDAENGTIKIQSGATATIANGKAWTCDQGITGAGTIVLNGTMPTLNAAWTGTVQLPAITSGGFNLNTYGNANSTVRLTGDNEFWLANDTFRPALELQGSLTLPAFSYTFPNMLPVLKGSGNLVVSSTAETAGSCFWIKDLSAFTGSLSATGNVGITLGGTAKQSSIDGKVVVGEDTSVATQASSITAKNGIIVNGTLKVLNASTLSPAPATTKEGYVLKTDTESEAGYTIYTAVQGNVSVYFVGPMGTTFANVGGPAFNVAEAGATYDYDYEIETGKTVQFTVTLDADYKAETLEVAASNGTVTKGESAYTLAGFTADTTVTATAEVKKVAQIGEVTYPSFEKALVAAKEGDVIKILDTTATLPEGYYNIDGNLVQGNDSAVAQIGSLYFTTLAGAIEAAQADAEVIVLKAVSADAVTIEKNLTLSVGGDFISAPQITLADGVTATVKCTAGGNKVLKVAGAEGAEVKPTFILDGNGNDNWGTTTATSIRNVKFVLTGMEKLWLDGDGNLDATVDLEIAKDASAVVDSGRSVTIGNLSGTGSFADRNSGTLTINATGTNTTFTGTRNKVTINVAGGADAVIASSLIKTVGATLADTWTGTVVYQQNGGAISFTDLGNANSTIRCNGVSGYPGDGTSFVYDGTVEMVDNGETPALNITAGQSTRVMSLAKVTGGGTIKATHICDQETETQAYGVLKNVAGFGGNIIASADYGWSIGEVPEGTTVADMANKIVVQQGATAFIWAGKSWTADTIVMNGTLKVIKGTTAPEMTTTIPGGIIKSEEDYIGAYTWVIYTVGTAVAQITDGETTTKYASIDDAVEAATEGQVVEVISDVAEEYGIHIGGGNTDAVIDLGLHTVTTPIISGDGTKTVTIKNGTVVSAGYGFYVAGTPLVLTNVAVNAVLEDTVAFYLVSGSLTIEAGTIVNVANGAAITQSTTCPVTIKGGKFKGSVALTDTSLIEDREGYTKSWSEADADGFQVPVWTAPTTWPEGWGELPEGIKSTVMERFNTWKAAYSVTDFTGPAEAAFMLNVAPDADVTLVVADITIDGTTVEITTNQKLKDANVIVYVQSGSSLTAMTNVKSLVPAEDYDETGKVVIMADQEGSAGFYKVGVGYALPTK